LSYAGQAALSVGPPGAESLVPGSTGAGGVLDTGSLGGGALLTVGLVEVGSCEVGSVVGTVGAVAEGVFGALLAGEPVGEVCDGVDVVPPPVPPLVSVGVSVGVAGLVGVELVVSVGTPDPVPPSDGEALPDDAPPDEGPDDPPDGVGGVVPGSEPAPLVPPAPFAPPVLVPESDGVVGPPPLSVGLSDRADRTTDVPQATWLPSVGRDAVTWASSAGRLSPAYDMPSPASVSRWVASAKVMPVTGGTACFCWVSKDLSWLPSLPTGRAIPRSGWCTSTSWSLWISCAPGGGWTTTTRSCR
jgi:hypothetical protein